MNPYPDFRPRKWVYVAGPYSGGDTVANVQAAVDVGNLLWDAGLFPYIPHLTHLWHLITPKPYEIWLQIDLQGLMKCDAMFRMPGESSGADKEAGFFVSGGGMVYLNLEQLVMALLGEKPDNWEEIVSWSN